MNKKILNGILLGAAGSFWWGLLGVFYFKKVSFAGPLELVVHRTIWTAFFLAVTTTFYSRWSLFTNICKKKNKLFILFICGLLIFANWSVWIYAVVVNKLVDASFGYYIFPIISVFFGYVFFNEKLNISRIFSISLVLISIIYFLINVQSVPFIGLSVAFTWSAYNILRKKIKVEADIGLLIESIFLTPIALVIFYFIAKKGLNDFSLSDPKTMFWLFIAGPMTVIPLYLYIKGVELAGLGSTGMIFFITPTCQFLLGIFYYGEIFDINKLIGFIFIWIAVIIYLRDIYQGKNTL